MGTVNLSYKDKELEITFQRQEPSWSPDMVHMKPPFNEVTVIRDTRGKDVTVEYSKEDIEVLTQQIN